MMHHVGVVQDVECNQDLLGEQNGMPCTTGPEKKETCGMGGGRYPIPCWIPHGGPKDPCKARERASF